MKGFLSNPLFRFTAIASALYLIWYILYEFLIKYKTSFDDIIIDNLVVISRKLLTIFGYGYLEDADLLYEEVVQIAGSMTRPVRTQ